MASDGGMPILREIQNKELEPKSVSFQVGSKNVSTSQGNIEDHDGGGDSGGDGQSLSGDGLTFEKRKIIPQRRTQSQQSMLSSISLRSITQDQQMHRNSMGGGGSSSSGNIKTNNNHTNNNPTDTSNDQLSNSHGGPPNVSHSLLNISQQIRSPAMFSIRRTGSLMQQQKKTSTESSFRTKSVDLDLLESDEIGKKLPFTNDERVDIRQTRKEKLQKSPLQLHVEPQQESQDRGESAVGSHDSVLTEGRADQDEEISQKNLTTQALRKLSNFKTQNVKESFKDSALENKELQTKIPGPDTSRGSDGLASNENIGNSYKTAESTPKTRGSHNELNHGDQTPRNNDQSSTETDTSRTSSNNILNFTSKSLTHMKFGDKNILIDNSIDVPSSNLNHINQVSTTKHKTNGIGIPRMHSSEILQKPVRYAYQNGVSISNSQFASLNRRNIKQIKNPKKPLYVPVVLRDVAETNITNEDLENLADKMTRQKSPSHRIGNLGEEELGSQKSLRSNGSSVIESYRRYISSLIFSNRNDRCNNSGSASNQRNFTPSTMGSYSSSVISINSRSPQLPTRRHWVPDSKRSACHQCHKLFTFFDRKHHCRQCGDIFCNKHLRHWLYLDSDAKFVIGGGGVGTLSKVCDNCHLDYEELARTNLSPTVANSTKREAKSLSRIGVRENGNHMSLDASLAGEQSISKPIVVKKNETEDTKNKSDQENLNSVVGSVPADWNWSSF